MIDNSLKQIKRTSICYCQITPKEDHKVEIAIVS